jgi:hypothetical protein
MAAGAPLAPIGLEWQVVLKALRGAAPVHKAVRVFGLPMVI